MTDFKKMHETIAERVGIEMDTPEMAPFWEAVSEHQDSMDLVVDKIIDETVKYIVENTQRGYVAALIEEEFVPDTEENQ